LREKRLGAKRIAEGADHERHGHSGEFGEFRARRQRDKMTNSSKTGFAVIGRE